MKVTRSRSKRKAISGIVAAVILFAMLFTVGTGFFLFVNTENGAYQAALLGSTSGVSNKIIEELAVTTISTSAPKHIAFFYNNTGGITSNVTAYFLLSSTGTVLKCVGIGVPSSCTTDTTTFPIITNVGKGLRVSSTGQTYLDTGITPVSGSTYTLKILTAMGNVFSATYPPTASTLASEALSSGAIGDLYLQPNTFTYYEVCTTVSGSCNSCKSGSGCYMRAQGKGFTITQAFTESNVMAFSMIVTDYNPNHANITLDADTVLVNFYLVTGSGSSFKNNYWYIVSNSSTQIRSSYTPITLSYGEPVELFFASNTIGTYGGTTVNSNVYSSTPSIALVFLLTHGCEGIKASDCGTATYNYGQNSPYVTTEYT
jgi:flagellin-like protein